jgi:MSHA biogenesis protein MshL
MIQAHISRMLKWLVAAGISATMVACVPHPPKASNVQHEIDRALSDSIANNKRLQASGMKSLPRSVNAALMPGIHMKRLNVKTRGERFDVDVKAVPIDMFFQGLVKDTSYSVIVSPDVSGKVTINLKGVSIPEAIDAVCETYNLGYKQTRYGYQILPNALETRIFTVNYLDVKRQGNSQTTVSASQLSSNNSNDSGSSGSSNSSNNSSSSRSGGLGALLGGGNSGSGSNSGGADLNSGNNSAVITTSRADFWAELKQTLTTIIGKEKGRSVVVNAPAGLVIVRAYPKELREVARYLDSAQNIMDRQVILEAKILEVQLNAQYESGINWHLLGLAIDNTGLDTHLQDFSSIFNVEASSGGTFSGVMKLLSSQGRVSVLSSPRISTLNNQKAIIKVGGDQFFVTNVANTTTAGTTASDSTQSIDLTPFFSGIALDVTPQIGPNGEVTLHIHPIISRVTEDNRRFVVSGQAQNLPLAKTTVRESDSIVRAKDGEVIVIGGLMEDGHTNYKAGTPGISRTIANPLFGRDNLASGKNELVILLRPVLVSNHTWTRDMQRARAKFKTTAAPYRYSVSRANRDSFK